MTLQGMEPGGAAWASLVAAGVDERALLRFMKEPGRPRKAPEARFRGARENVRLIGELLDAGGSIAGGAALDYVMGTRHSRDVDVFFDSLPGYASALLRAYDNPSVDVVLTGPVPWASFDLCAAMCSVSRRGADVSPRCAEALRTGVSDLDLSNVVFPAATVGRVAKYGRIRGFKFRAEQVILVGAAGGVPEREIREALAFCA